MSWHHLASLSETLVIWHLGMAGCGDKPINDKNTPWDHKLTKENEIFRGQNIFTKCRQL